MVFGVFGGKQGDLTHSLRRPSVHGYVSDIHRAHICIDVGRDAGMGRDTTCMDGNASRYIHLLQSPFVYRYSSTSTSTSTYTSTPTSTSNSSSTSTSTSASTSTSTKLLLLFLFLILLVPQRLLLFLLIFVL